MWLTQIIKTRGKFFHIVFQYKKLFETLHWQPKLQMTNCRLWCGNKLLNKIPSKAFCCLATQPTTFSILCSKRRAPSPSNGLLCNFQNGSKIAVRLIYVKFAWEAQLSDHNKFKNLDQFSFARSTFCFA